MNVLFWLILILVLLAIASINHRLWQLIVLQRKQNELLEDVVNGLAGEVRPSEQTALG